MTRLINLARAARLVGVTRVALQRKIKERALPSFEGMVSEEGLLQVYPDVQFEDNTCFDLMAQTKLLAHDARAAERLPSKEVLAARLNALGKELSDSQAELHRYRSVVDGLEEQLDALKTAGEEVQGAAASLKTWLHQALQACRPGGEFRNLTIRDSFLRVMAAQVQLQPSGHEFFVDGADTVLEAALRAGVALDYGCSNGHCGKCKARVLSGELMKVRPHDYVLSAAEAAAGYALMCSHTAVTDVVIRAGEAEAAADIPLQRVTAHVKSISALGDETLLLLLRTPPHERLRFLAGQNVLVRFGPSLAAQLPVAGCPCDDRNLPFHIRKTPGNILGEYVATRLKAGDAVAVEGPTGNFSLRQDSFRPLIFLAFGNGFAPLKGMMEQAIALDTAESMHLYWIVAQESDLYYPNWPRAMARALDNFSYTPLLTSTNLETAGGRQERLLGGLLEQIGGQYPTLAEVDVYVAGPEALVDASRQWLLAHGLPERQLSVAALG